MGTKPGKGTKDTKRRLREQANRSNKKQAKAGNAAFHTASSSRSGRSTYEATFRGANPKRVGPYSNSHDILVVGDGNFSWSRALALAIGGRRLVCTSYDSRRDVVEKYEGVLEFLTDLANAGSEVLHGVDGTALGEDAQLVGWMQANEGSFAGFHRIVFNFPSIGGSLAEDVERNKELLVAFFRSAPSVLAIGGEVHVSLRDTSFYDAWGIEELGGKAGMKLARTFPFNADEYRGYESKRTAGDLTVKRAAPSNEGAKTYELCCRCCCCCCCCCCRLGEGGHGSGVCGWVRMCVGCVGCCMGLCRLHVCLCLCLCVWCCMYWESWAVHRWR